MLSNYSKWALAILGGCAAWLFIGLCFSVANPGSYPGASGFILPGLANALNSLTAKGITIDFSFIIWGVEILFGVLFSVYTGAILILLAECSDDPEFTIKILVGFISSIMILFFFNYAGTQLL